MKCFDTHIHSEGRSVEDLLFMSSNGIKAAVICAFYPIELLYQETMIDLFRRLIESEKGRGSKAEMVYTIKYLNSWSGIQNRLHLVRFIILV